MIPRWIVNRATSGGLAILGLRIALGTSFLSAVADRFGGWGPPGAKQVSWGDFAHFVTYTGMVNSFLPKSLIIPIAWIATVAEVILGVTLILGIYVRLSAFLSGLLLGTFALAMSFSMGLKPPLSYSVFTDSAAAFVLASIYRRSASHQGQPVAIVQAKAIVNE